MSIWAGKQTQRALAAVSYHANIKPKGIDTDSVQVKVVAPLEQLILTVSRLPSVKPELQLASQVLVACKSDVNAAIEPQALEKLEHPSSRM